MNASRRRRAASARRLASSLVALVALGSATGCFDDVDGDNERDINDTEVLLRDVGDAETGPVDMAVVIDMEPEVDADLRPCQPGDDGGACTAGLGECEASGRKICQDGMFVCDAEPGEPKEELCNGVDDDCDGNVDELLTERCYDDDANGTAGVGRCVAGVSTCAAGEWGACEGQIVPGDETCDGSDEDCDGAVDELAPRRCYDDDENGTDGVGVCTAGLEACVDGEWGACEGQVVPAEEACDGADRDCDGTVDEVAPRRCYDDDENGTDGVGRCVAGTESCVDGGWGPCEGQILPGPETCDGTDENCDGRVDVGPDPDAPDQQIGVCGELVADHCRLWLMWSRDRDIDVTIGDSFNTWSGCPLEGDPPPGRSDVERCTDTGFDRAFHSLALPLGHEPGANDVIGLRWQCVPRDRDGALLAPDVARRLADIQSMCRVTIGEQWSQVGWLSEENLRGRPEGPAISEAWNPCDPEAPDECTCLGVDGEDEFGLAERPLEGFASRCTSSFSDAVGDTRIRGWHLTAQLSEKTRLGVSFHCPAGDAPAGDDAALATARMFAAVQAQTSVWLGWASDPRPADTWDTCDEAEVIGEGSPQCVSTGGDGCFHRLRVNASLGADVFRPGGFGVALRARSPSEERVMNCDLPAENAQ